MSTHCVLATLKGAVHISHLVFAQKPHEEYIFISTLLINKLEH